MLSRRYQLLLLAVVLLAVFYPTHFAEVNSVDDRDMFKWLENVQSWRLQDLFFPSAAEGRFYRPLLILTFFLDKELWSLSPPIMHLENVLLHLLNAILVFTFARHLLPQEERKTSYAPLIATLCFALHPLAAEPVSWISGRTDVLAASFVLMSAVALLKFKLEHKKLYGLLALFALVLGTMSKEVALGFVPGAILLLMAKNPIQSDLPVATSKFWPWVKKFGGYLVFGGGALLIFFGFRALAFTSNSPRIGMTLQFMFNDLYATLFVFLRAFGFYLKKLYWPFPLNFAIVEVDPLYELLAMALIILCLWIVTRRTLLSATFIAGLFLIVPALPIAFNQIAWTPYAERYVYVASAFVSIATIFYLRDKLFQHFSPQAVTFATCALIILMGGATLQRNLVVQTNLSLYSDTVQKSPGFAVAWNQLGIAYYDKNDFKNAEVHFRNASSMRRLYYDEMFDLNLASALAQQGKYDEAEEVYAMVFKNGEKTPRAAKHYEEFLQTRKVEVEK